MDRWFVTSDDPEYTKRQFGHILVNHRPALEILFNECRAAHTRGNDAASNSSIIALESGNQDEDPDLTKTIQMKRHLKDYSSSLTMAEVYAGSLLLHLDEIVQSLVIELTHHNRWIGVGELHNGIPLSDALKACGNFVRHKTVWTLQMSRRGTLDELPVKSLWRLGALLTEHPERDQGLPPGQGRGPGPAGRGRRLPAQKRRHRRVGAGDPGRRSHRSGFGIPAVGFTGGPRALPAPSGGGLTLPGV